MPTPRFALPLLLLAVGCDNERALPQPGDPDDTAEGWRPEVACPGDAGCASNDGPLQAGAAARVITPPCFESWVDTNDNQTWQQSEDTLLDCGCDRLCEGDAGYPGPDTGEGDGELQAVWMAGFQNNRPAQGIHDDIEARALVVESGDTRVGLVILDVVGWFYDDALRVRAAAAGADLDLVIVQSTHNHEGPDTMGQWGPNLTTPGKDPVYRDFVVEQAAAALLEAASALQPATLTVAEVDTAAPYGDKGTRNLVRDSRDPVIIDQMMGVARFADASGATIATLANWGNHPEALADENLLLTSDYPHFVREALEGGVAWDPPIGDPGRGEQVDGLGGVALFSSGSVGGLMTPLGVTVTGHDGVDYSGHTFEKAEAMGKVLAQLAIEALAQAEPAGEPRVSFGAQEVFLPVHNDALKLAHALGVLERQLYNYDPTLAINDLNRPDVLTQVSLVEIGPLQMLGMPGELMPELAIGGYDGSRVNTTEDPFLDPDNEDPPDLSQAPDGPYFKDQMGGQVNLILGLANDELGYLVPPYDYKLDETLPYLDEPPGDHYEETNSLGPDAVPMISEMVTQLTAWMTAQ